MKLKDKRALITGATGVIGSAVARVFAREGAALYLTGLSLEKLRALRADIGDSVRGVCAADISKTNEVDALGAWLKGETDNLDIVVTAAGTYGEIGPLRESDGEAWQRALAVNLFGTVWTVRVVLPLLEHGKKARIITFAGGGEGALPNFSSYACSKAAVLRLTETLARELEDFGITVNAISPGLVNSGLSRDIIAAGPERAGEKKYGDTVKQIEHGENVVSPELAAKLATFLASDESDGLTGRNISAVWDTWEELPRHIGEIMETDVYTTRRIKPIDRGMTWK